MIGFDIVNKSDNVSAKDLAAWAHALQRQISLDLAKPWGAYGSLRVGAKVYGSPFSDRIIVVPLTLTDSSDVPDALGYHDIDSKGVPYIKIFVKDTLDAGVSISSVMSHEILETLVDPFVQCFTLQDNQDTTGTLYIAEVADPTEADEYQIEGVGVSNFITPAWFGQGQPGPYDFLENLHKPLSITAGGYFSSREISRRGLGPWQQTAGRSARFWNGRELP